MIFSVQANVPAEAAEIIFGVVFSGVGKVWINGFKFEVVSKDEPLTDNSKPRKILMFLCPGEY